MIDVSILIPVYNAAPLVADTTRRLQKEFLSMGFSYEIIFCDDGSLDESRRVLQELTSDEAGQRIRCFFNERNRGLGFTLRRMAAEARGEVLIYLDCDLPFGTEVIPALLDKIQGVDIAVASRYHRGRGNIPFLRWAVSRLYAKLCQFLFGIRICDIGSGSVAFRRDFFFLLPLSAEGFSIHIEIFAQAHRSQGKVCEFYFSPSFWRQGSFSVFKYAPGIAVGTFQLWFVMHQKCAGRSVRGSIAHNN